MAEPLNAYLENAYAILLVILGISFVIFIHELGHFLLAKWAGVKVEMFSIGFGPTLISWRKGFGLRFGSSVKDYLARTKAGDLEAQPTAEEAGRYGETEYSLRALPLGGFVKMMGEDGGGVEAKSSDPRAYHNKPVGSRMAIISAGVVMNLSFGVACATWVHIRGGPAMPAVVGSVVAGQPAYEAGIRPGDEIVAIDGHQGVWYKDLVEATSLSVSGQKLIYEIKRPGLPDRLRMPIEPRRVAGADTPTIGVGSQPSLDLAPGTPPGLVSDRVTTDRILAVGPSGEEPTPVSDHLALQRLLMRHRARPVQVVVERGAADFDERALKPKTVVEVTLAPMLFRDFGMRMTPGPIAAIRPDSPAAKAGLRVGDRIVSVDGRVDFDPMRLPDLAYDAAGKPMRLEVRRSVDGRDATVPIQVTPDLSPPWSEPVMRSEPLEVPGLGLALIVEPRVAAVVPGSPADRAKVVPDDVVTSLFAEPKPTGQAPGPVVWKKPVDLGGEAGASWPWAFQALQGDPGPYRLGLAGGRSVVLEAAPVPGWFRPGRGLEFIPVFRNRPPQPFASAVREGWRDTQDMALSILRLIRNMVQGRVGAGGVGGPVLIADMAFQTAKFGGLAAFLPFLGMLSVNLAVLNFLPIPPLDGGQMTFLIAEKVRGRPLPENAVAYPTIVGVVFVLVLFVVVFFKDVMRYF